MKVALSFLIYPMTMAHWFWRAFERREDVELFVVGPYFADWIPWGGGMTLPIRYVKQPNLPLPRQAATFHIHPQMIVDKVPKDLDLWIQIDAGWHFSARPPAQRVVHIQTDPHVLKQTYALPKSYSDISYCMQNCYREDDEYFLPYAYDPEIHCYQDVDKEYDACLIGLLYDHRKQLIEMLRSEGLKVYYNLGDIYDMYRIRYNQSHVALSWSSLLDTPARVWEAFGMQIPLVCNRTPDMKMWFNEGEDYLGFDDVYEADHKVWALIEEPDVAKTRAESAYNKVKDAHTWDKRVETILRDTGLL